MKLLQLNEVQYAGKLPNEFTINVPVTLPTKEILYFLQNEIHELLYEYYEDNDLLGGIDEIDLKLKAENLSETLLKQDEIRKIITEIIIKSVHDKDVLNTHVESHLYSRIEKILIGHLRREQ